MSTQEGHSCLASATYSGNESDQGTVVPAAHGKRHFAVAAAALGLVGSAAVAAVWYRQGRSAGSGESDVLRVIQKAETKDFTIARKWCSAPTEDCRDSGCCKTTGTACFEKDDKNAYCKQECNPADGWTCKDLTKARTMEVAQPGTSMYCYTVHFENSGNPLLAHEVEQLQMQAEKGLSIFACEAWDVFSDSPFSMGDYNAVVLEDKEGDFCKYTRPDTGSCANAAIFYQAWQAIRSTQKWKDQEWVVKTDADAVFVSSRLKAILASHQQPTCGVYFENCKGVDSGFFGSLEVVSTRGFSIVLDQIENCKYELCWGGEDCDGWEYGAFGEDKFLQECMDKHGVGKLPLFELTYDGMCPSDRPEDQKKNTKFLPPCWNSSAPVTHPFRTISAWQDCYSATMSVSA